MDQVFHKLTFAWSQHNKLIQCVLQCGWSIETFDLLGSDSCCIQPVALLIAIHVHKQALDCSRNIEIQDGRHWTKMQTKHWIQGSVKGISWEIGLPWKLGEVWQQEILPLMINFITQREFYSRLITKWKLSKQLNSKFEIRMDSNLNGSLRTKCRLGGYQSKDSLDRWLTHILGMERKTGGWQAQAQKRQGQAATGNPSAGPAGSLLSTNTFPWSLDIPSLSAWTSPISHWLLRRLCNHHPSPPRLIQVTPSAASLSSSYMFCSWTPSNVALAQTITNTASLLTNLLMHIFGFLACSCCEELQHHLHFNPHSSKWPGGPALLGASIVLLQWHVSHWPVDKISTG